MASEIHAGSLWIHFCLVIRGSSMSMRLHCNQIYIFFFGLSIGYLLTFSFYSWTPFTQSISANNYFVKPLPVIRENTNTTKDYECEILCWILTQPKTHKTKAMHVFHTWGRRCDRIFFITSSEDPDLPAIVLNVTELYHLLPEKVLLALEYLYKYHAVCKWFFKADDDTYTVIENLRAMLKPFNANEPVVFGMRIGGYFAGGPGYVMSKKALQLLINRKTNRCNSTSVAEDILMGECFSSLGIKMIDARDDKQRMKFFQWPIALFLSPEGFRKRFEWASNLLPKHPEPGVNCCSSHLVSMHDVKPEMMYVYDFLIYTFKKDNSDENQLQT